MLSSENTDACLSDDEGLFCAERIGSYPGINSGIVRRQQGIGRTSGGTGGSARSGGDQSQLLFRRFYRHDQGRSDTRNTGGC